jgi:uncharacterized DUF497 family protein
MAKFEFSGWLLRWLRSRETFEFVWDEGIETKSKQKHDVNTTESEQAFYDADVYPLGSQIEPEVNEPRFGILGRTPSGRHLHVVFTVRTGAIRIISARPMHRKEKTSYEQALRQE